MPSPSLAPTATRASRYYAKDVSALLAEGAGTRLTRRHVRYAQRGILWRESAIERIRKCGRVSTGEVIVRLNDGIAHYAGLTTCGSVWACPCCQSKILNRRAGEISRAAGRWQQQGNTVVMTTFTMPHDAGMPLAALLRVISGGFRSVLSGRPWLRLKKQLGIVGTIRSVEVTHWHGNGWHPHLHTLAFVTADLDAHGLAAFSLHTGSKWRNYIEKAGYRRPDHLHGVKIDVCTSAAEAGAYIAKTDDGRSVGNEVARGDLKKGRSGHRTPLQILEDFRQTGDIEDLALWHEYERATKGHQRITWSKGLRALLLPDDAEEQSDEDLAAEEVGGEDVATVTEAWPVIVAVPGLPAAVLDAAEHAGVTGIVQVLAQYGVTLTEGGPSP